MGAHEAIEAIYDANLGRIYGYIRARVASDHDAEDLTAETFLHAFGGLTRFQPRHDGATTAWLFRIARNLVLNFHRRERRAPTLSLEELAMDPVAADDPARAAEQAEARRQLLALIGGLPPRHQEVIALKYFGNLRNQEIAALLALDQRTVAAYLTRALAELQQRLGGSAAAGAWELATEAQGYDVAAALREDYTGLRRSDATGFDQLLRAAAPVADEAFRAGLRARLLAPRRDLLRRLLDRVLGRSADREP
jgi:RNA polymerase sigma-70 factor, ECF subfamily